MPEQSSLKRIFISYRREDSAAVAGRIYDRLVQKYGKKAIFKDVDSIPLGVNFKHHIDSVVSQCDVVLVIIGDKWAESGIEIGKRRIDRPQDFVRLEIESALQRDIPVVPLLVQNAEVPNEESIPPAIKELTYRHGMSIGHDPHFHSDMDRLIRQLEDYFSDPSRKQDGAQYGVQVHKDEQPVADQTSHLIATSQPINLDSQLESTSLEATPSDVSPEMNEQTPHTMFTQKNQGQPVSHEELKAFIGAMAVLLIIILMGIASARC